ncbi:DNA gyrase C-terminal beta-propeller domain-containing protein [Chloroflexota bacterium]
MTTPNEMLNEHHMENTIPHQRVNVMLSDGGFIKRIPSRTYPQLRGGKGVIGIVSRESDAVRLLTVADIHDSLLFFTNRGKAFGIRCQEIPAETYRAAKGTDVRKLFPIAECERITAMIPVTKIKPDLLFVMATRNGEVKKTAGSYFASVRSSGLIAIDLEEGDEIVAASLATDQDDVILVTQRGKAITFAVSSLRAASRTSGGVRGVNLASGDHVVGMDIVRPKSLILLITVNGYGKLVPVTSFRRQRRGGIGVMTFSLNDKTGDLALAKLVTKIQQLMIISRDGVVIDTPLLGKDPRQGIPVCQRGAQGVRLLRLDPGDKVVAVVAFD